MTTALEQQREDQALGAAWRRCEAALVLLSPRWTMALHRNEAEFGYTAEAHGYDFMADALTPTEALEALADALEARRAAE